MGEADLLNVPWRAKEGYPAEFEKRQLPVKPEFFEGKAERSFHCKLGEERLIRSDWSCSTKAELPSRPLEEALEPKEERRLFPDLFLNAYIALELHLCSERVSGRSILHHTVVFHA